MKSLFSFSITHHHWSEFCAACLADSFVLSIMQLYHISPAVAVCVYLVQQSKIQGRSNTLFLPVLQNIWQAEITRSATKQNHQDVKWAARSGPLQGKLLQLQLGKWVCCRARQVLPTCGSFSLSDKSFECPVPQGFSFGVWVPNNHSTMKFCQFFLLLGHSGGRPLIKSWNCFCHNNRTT